MPVYEFECSQCGEKFSEKRTFEEFDKQKSTKCPKCGSRQTRRLLSTTFAKTSKKS
ncbi:MAG: FmdB family zinc ribbon protein [Thermoguttaceae bacterium]